MTVSTSTSTAKVVAETGPHLDVGGACGDDAIPLLQSKCNLVAAGLTIDVLRAVMPLDRALARLIRVAVFRILRRHIVAPLPLHGRTVEVGVVIGTAAQNDRHPHTQRREADRRRRLE